MIEEVDRARGNGATVVFLAVDNQLAVVLGVIDPLKDSAVDAIQQLRELDVSITVMTGDDE